MWHTVAMAASDMLLLDGESGPLRVYVEELKPTPEGDLEILLQKRWVSPPQRGTPRPQGCGPPRGWGVGGTKAPGTGNRAQRSPSPQSLAQGCGAKRPSHKVALGSVWGEARVQDAGYQGLGSCCQESCLPQRMGAET